MATVRFDGTDDLMSGSGQGGMTGPLTAAMLVHRTATGGTDYLFSTGAATTGFGFGLGNGDRLQIYNDNGAITSAAPGASHTITNTTDWYIVGFSRGSGETPVFHMRNFTGAGSWQHAAGETTQTTDPDSASGGFIKIGTLTIVGAGDFDFGAFDAALIGWWNVEFSNADFEALDDNGKTSDWHNHSAGAPASLTELTSLTPTDLEGLVTWSNSGATLAGADPSGWTFDGMGSGPTAGGALVRPGRHRGRYPARDVDWY